MNIDDFENFINLHGKIIYSFCLRLTSNKEDAEDLYQQTFLKAFEIIDKIDKNNNPKSFLISIAINLWKNNNKKFARRHRLAPTSSIDDSPLTEVADNISIENLTINKLLQEDLMRAVVKLPYKYKIIILMHYTGGLSTEEMASILRIPRGTIKSRLHKGRLMIKKELEVKGYEGYGEYGFFA